MKSVIHSAIALSLLTFASAPFAQDAGDGEGGGGFEWLAGAQANVTKYEDNGFKKANGYGFHGGMVLDNRFGLELGDLELGEADVKGAPAVNLKTNVKRVMFTAHTLAGDSPVRLGVGWYRADADLGGTSKTSSGPTLGVRFEQGVTENLFLTLSTDLILGMDIGGRKDDAIVFGLGVAFHTAPPAPPEEQEDTGVQVTPVEGGYGDYDSYGSDSGSSGEDSGDTGDMGDTGDSGGDAPSADDYGDYGGDSSTQEPGGDEPSDQSPSDDSGEAPSSDDNGDNSDDSLDDALPQ